MFNYIKRIFKTYKLIKMLTAEIIKLEDAHSHLQYREDKRINELKQQGVKGMFFKVTGKKWKH